MASSNLICRQTDAVAFVRAQKWNILTTAKKINPRISLQDLDDLVSEGFAIALEIVASEGTAELRSLFWPKLQRAVWEGYDYLVDYVDPSGETLCDTSTVDPLEKMATDCALDATASSILDFLAPAERLVFCLMLGLTSRGYCHDREAAHILGISRRAVRTQLTRILAKIESAIRHQTAEGYLILHRRGLKRSGAPPGPSACRPSRIPPCPNSTEHRGH